jgi:hypothetical protein
VDRRSSATACGATHNTARRCDQSASSCKQNNKRLGHRRLPNIARDRGPPYAHLTGRHAEIGYLMRAMPRCNITQPRTKSYFVLAAGVTSTAHDPRRVLLPSFIPFSVW